jgi:hypothetical protein
MTVTTARWLVLIRQTSIRIMKSSREKHGRTQTMRETPRGLK